MPYCNTAIIIGRVNFKMFSSKEVSMDKNEIYSFMSFGVKILLLPLLVCIMRSFYSTGSRGIASPVSMAAGIVEFLAGIIVGYLIWSAILLLEMAIIRRKSIVITNLYMMVFLPLFFVLLIFLA